MLITAFLATPLEIGDMTIGLALGGDGGTLATGGVRPEMGPDLGVRGGAPRKVLALGVHFQAQTACGGMMCVSANEWPPERTRRD